MSSIGNPSVKLKDTEGCRRINQLSVPEYGIATNFKKRWPPICDRFRRSFSGFSIGCRQRWEIAMFATFVPELNDIPIPDTPNVCRAVDGNIWHS